MAISHSRFGHRWGSIRWPNDLRLDSRLGGSGCPGIALSGSFLVVHRGLHRPIRHGFSFGFLSGLIAMELQALFLTLYFAYNPEYELIEIPFGLPARLATAIFAPVNAMIAGLFTVGLVWILGKIWNRAA